MAKILLVEDDNNLREIYEARLQAEGYQIATARDGEEALVVAKQEHPDLVISDVMMPKISGFEMLDILRNTDGMQAVKVIMLTALGQNDDQQRANQLGADRYLVKSQVTLEDIVRVAHELLGDTPAAATPPTATAQLTDVPMVEPPTEPPAAAPAADTPLKSPVNDPTDSVTPVTADEAAAEATKDAESTAEETAAMDTKIEDIVSGASSDAPAPANASAPEPAPADARSTDDKLLADAVNNLVKSTEEAEPEPAPAEEPKTEPTKGSVSGPKVIQPMETPPKPDIVAAAAKESPTEPAKSSGPVVNDVTPPRATATPADPADPNDPRNLAL